MAKKTVKAQPAKKAAKPAKKAAPVKKAASAKKTEKPASAKKAEKTVAKKTTSPAKKVATKAATKPAPVTKTAAPKKAVVAETKKTDTAKAAKKNTAVVNSKAAAILEKENSKKENAKKKVSQETSAAPATPKEQVKTVEQQMQERQSAEAKPSSSPSKSTGKEELFVPKYTIPVVTEPSRPMRPKPAAQQPEAPSKPVANPIFVPPAPDGKAGIKFAPIANLERPKEKEKEKATNKSAEEDMNSKTSPRLAFNEGDDKKGVSVEAKLRALYAIQLIDSRIDKIHAMRGELPLEVQDLEDDIVGLETRLSKFNDELKSLTDSIATQKQGIKDSEALIKKYKEQLNNVKNNREFDSLNKEVEYQELEIELFKKNIRNGEGQLAQKNELLTAADNKLKERKNDLKIKRTELDDIIASTEKEEQTLQRKSAEMKKTIDDRLISAYERIRSGAPNKTAVVPIEREASAGSFIKLPPQKQLDVAARKRVIVDEHSGRILVDAELAMEEQEKITAMLAQELK